MTSHSSLSKPSLLAYSGSQGARFKLLESAIWLVFLLLFAATSFVIGGYAERSWLFFSACFYLWFCCALTLIAFGGRCNWHAIKSARWVIGFMALSLVWLLLPTFVPYEHALYDVFYGVFYDAFQNTAANNGAALSWLKLEHSWAVAPDRLRWLLMSELLFFCLFLSTLAMVDRRSRLKQLLVLFVVLGVIHALIGLFGQIAGILFVDAREVDGHFSVARGLFVNRNHFGAFIVLTLVGAIALQARFFIKHSGQSLIAQLREQVLSRYALVLACLVLGFIACLSSTSRGALLSLVLAVALVVATRKDQKLSDWRNGLGVAMLLIAISVFYFGQDLLARFTSDSLSLGERAQQWGMTLDAIMQNPLLGYGGGSYKTVFQIFRGDAELRQVVFAQSHNHYLHVWLERGLIGLGLWLVIWAAVLREAHRNSVRSRSSLIRGTMIAALVVVTAALVQSLVEFNLQILNIRAYFFVVMAIVFAAPQLKR